MEFNDAVKRVEIGILVDQRCAETERGRSHKSVSEGNLVGGFQLCRLAAQNVIGMVPLHWPASHFGECRRRVGLAPFLDGNVFDLVQ